jgi:uncharacterized membrane protein required for colicin V production
MNIVDYAILAVIGLSLLFGFYRGFVSTVLNTGGCLVSFGLSFVLYPKLADAIQNNEDLLRTLMHYTDASSRIGDLELAITNVSQLTADKISEIISKVELPSPFDQLLQANLEKQVYAATGLTSVSDYVSQTILTACINIICFIVCFVVLFLVISIVMNFLRAVFRFPLLKQLDWLAGGVLGFARGVLICYVVLAVAPIILTMVPVQMISDLLNESTFAPFFNNGSMVLAIMNGRL